MPGRILLALAILAAAPLARAQTAVSTPLLTNASSLDEGVQSGVMGYCGAARKSTLSVVAPGGGATFTTRYTANVFVDNDLAALSCNARHEVLDTDYTLDFTATAPRIYRLVVDTRRTGDATVLNDAVPAQQDGQVDQGAVACAWSGGTLVGGSCDLPDPGPPINVGTVPYNQSSTLTLCGTSNGMAVAHAVQFLWTQRAYSGAVVFPSQQGDFGMIRLGDDLPPPFSGSFYPGTPPRTQANDGHFTSATLVNLCGNGVIDACAGDVEACDQGSANGSPGSCCTSDCRLKSAGASCRASAGTCDLGEVCTGTSPTCPPDVFVSSGTTCRATAGPCDVTDVCSGTAAACPDAMVPPGTLCRAQSDACDQADFCNGMSPLCADAFQPTGTVCRALQGQGGCDVAEQCTGGSPACPPDFIKLAATVCRPAAGACDFAEACDGVSPSCDPDQVATAGTVCNPSSGVCDPQEVCDGAGGTCPSDVDLTDADADLVCGPTDNCPDTPNPPQDDGDGDGVGDACDPCAGTLSIDAAYLRVRELDTPPGDDRLRFRGILAGLPALPTIDPLANGARFVMTDDEGNVVVDAVLAPGAYDPVLRLGWEQKGRLFKYRHDGTSGPPPGGVYRAAITVLPGSPTAAARLLLKGRYSDYTVAGIPVRLSGSVSGIANGATQCADETFADDPLGNPERCDPVTASGWLRCD